MFLSTLPHGMDSHASTPISDSELLVTTNQSTSQAFPVKYLSENNASREKVPLIEITQQSCLDQTIHSCRLIKFTRIYRAAQQT